MPKTKADKYYCERCGKLCIKHSFFQKYNSVNGKKIYEVVYACPSYKPFLWFGNGHSVFYGVYHGGEHFVAFVEEK